MSAGQLRAPVATLFTFNWAWVAVSTYEQLQVFSAVNWNILQISIRYYDISEAAKTVAGGGGGSGNL